MRRNFKLSRSAPVILGALIGVCALATGCGNITQAGSATQGEVATPQPSSTASTINATSGQVTSGRVTLTLNKQRYAAQDTVVVTIANGLSQMIWAADHQTSCTELVAEQSHGGAWEAVAKCRLMTPTRLMALSPGITTVRLDASGWPTGTYRVTLTYTSGDEGMSGAGGIVHSAEFVID